MLYGYVRVSTKDQVLDRQIEALKAYKEPDKIFADKQSGKNMEREQYQAMKSVLKPGDEVIIKEMDRLGRNKDAVKGEIQWFKDHDVTLRILDLPTSLIDFQGQDWIKDMVNNVIIEVLSSIAEQERNKIHQRQEEGIKSMPVNEAGKKVSKKTGRTYGRQPVNPESFSIYESKVKKGEISISQACREMGISRPTYYKLIAA